MGDASAAWHSSFGWLTIVADDVFDDDSPIVYTFVRASRGMYAFIGYWMYKQAPYDAGTTVANIAHGSFK